jgi:DNA polymerase III subunit epsilon
MTAAKWHEGHLIAFDVESTGVNPHQDRIVTAAIVHVTPGNRPRTLSWLIDPGVEIPTEASDVHGWTADRLAGELDGAEARYSHVARQAPMTRAGALESIASQVAFAMTSGTPLVACNAAFDLTVLDAELARHDLPTLVQRVAGHTVANVVDPQVLDKAYDPFRRVKGGCTGSKKGYNCGGCGATDKTLSGLCTHYGIVLAGAHDAGADALAAARLAVRIVQGWPDAARLKLSTLHAHQVEWRREQRDSLRAYFDRAGTEHDGVCGSWPLHRGCACSQTAAAVA